MSAQVILVTGSRALADDPAATRWARKALPVSLPYPKLGKAS